MKIYTNENNTSTLKLLIAARLGAKNVVLEKATLEDDIFAGPNQLPLLVNDGFTFFSSNGAVQFLFPVMDFSQGRCLQLMEWELTMLHPAVTAVANAKTVPADLKQVLNGMLIFVEDLLKKDQYVLGDKLTSADISIWSTLYPLYFNDELKQKYLDEFMSIRRWMDQLAKSKAMREAVEQWNGSATAPFATTTALGQPLLPSVGTPLGSPDEVEVKVTAEELEAAKENWLNGRLKLDQEIAWENKLSSDAEIAESAAAQDKQQKVILPIKGRKNVLITSALPYVNNVPHLGNIIGCVLSADIFARYCRLCNYNTLFVCGTDEYGTATETKALQERVTPKEICDKYFVIHKAVYDWFNISFDYFGRTSTKQQTKICQDMFLKLMNNGFVSTQSVDQLHCTNCDRFLADRFVEGTCPHPGCKYESARGDQCDKCGKLINAIELIEPRCKVCGHAPSVKASEQLFIELGQLEHSIRTWVQLTDHEWSAPARAVCRSWLREPLRARAVTRDLKWGVPVPVAGFENKVFYVWFDAPIGYMSITENATNQHEKWWKPDKEYDVKLYQFMAKDNVPFHAIMFPATMLGVNEGHVLVSHLFATEYLNYEEGKFSKSRGVGVFGTDAQETGIQPDVWRFYLASIRPETSDSSFSWTELGTRNNSELLNNLGNFCHRSLSFCVNYYKGLVPEVVPTPADYELMARVNREAAAYVQNMEKGRLREALRHVMSVSRLGNQLIQSEKPWVLLKGTDEEKQHGSSTIGLCCQLVALLCALLIPYMPTTSRRLMTQLQLDPAQLTISSKNPSLLQYIPSGHVIGKSEPLFAKIEPEKLDYLRAKYAGTQSERDAKQFHPESGNATVAQLYFAISYQNDLVRELTARTTNIAIVQPQIDKLNELRAILSKAYNDGVLHNNGSSKIYKRIRELQKAHDARKDALLALRAMDNASLNGNQKRNAKKRYNKVKKLLRLAHEQAKADFKDLEKATEEQEDKVNKLEASGNKAEWKLEHKKLLQMKKQLRIDQNPFVPSSMPSEADVEAYIAKQDKVKPPKPPSTSTLIKKYMRKRRLTRGERNELKRLQEMEEERKSKEHRAANPTIADIEVKVARTLAKVHMPMEPSDHVEMSKVRGLMEKSRRMQQESVEKGSYAYIDEVKAEIELQKLKVKTLKSTKQPREVWLPEDNVLREMRERLPVLIHPPPSPISERSQAKMLKMEKREHTGYSRSARAHSVRMFFRHLRETIIAEMTEAKIEAFDAGFKLLEEVFVNEIVAEMELEDDKACQTERLKTVEASDRNLRKPEETRITMKERLPVLQSTREEDEEEK